MCNAFFLSKEARNFFFLEKAALIYNFISLIHSYVIKNHIYKTPVIIWPCHILFMENYHQLFKH